MVNLVEVVALIMLGAALVKNIIGLASPTILKEFTETYFLSHYSQKKKILLPLFLIMTVALLYVTYTSGITLSQWLVAGYSAIMIFVLIIFVSGDAFRHMTESLIRASDSHFRMISALTIIFSSIGIYIILS